MNHTRTMALAGLFLAGGWLSGCGGGSSGSNTPIAVTLSTPPPASLAVTSTASIVATVSSDPGNAGVTWSATCSASDCGSFNPGGTASGSATVYTPPASVPSPATVTVTATSVTDTTKSAAATVTLTSASTAVLADGTYVFHLSGEDGTGPYFVSGAFKVSAGLITAGEQDFADADPPGYHDALVASGCSLSTVGGNIQIVLATANQNIGQNGIETLRGTLVSSARALLSEYDGSAAGSGSLDLQTGTAAPSGGYAFAVSGEDTNNGNVLALGGILNVSGTTVSVSNSIFDFNDGGSSGTGLTFASGTVSAPDAFGRVSFGLTPAASSTVPGIILVGYIVGPNRIELVEDQSDALTGDLGGPALGQGANTGKFSLTSVLNKTYVQSSAGADANGGLTLAGTFVFNPNGILSGEMALNDIVNSNTNSLNGSYSIDALGRITFTQVVLSPGAVTFYFQMYLDGNGNALVIGVDSFEVTQGMAYLGTATSTTLSGNYALSAQGLLDAANLPGFGAVGPVKVAASAITGTTDYSVVNAGLQSAVALTGTVNSTTHSMSLKGLNGVDFTVANSWIYYPIDATRTLAMENDGNQLGIMLLESVAP